MVDVPLLTRLLPPVVLLALLALAAWVVSRRSGMALLQLPFEHPVFGWVTGPALILFHLLFSQVFFAKYAVFRLFYLIFVLLLLAGIFVNHVVRKKEKFSGTVQGLFTFVFSVQVLFILAECVFLFPARTHGYTPTFASMNWYYAWGGPYDELGYRARTLSDAEKSNPKKILFIGDSFLAGSGVRDLQNRFASLLEKDLSPEYTLVVRAIGGHDTRKELEELKKFEGKPELVVLNWIPDDLLVAAESMGYHFPMRTAYSDLNPLSRFFIRHSYSLNYLYWSFPHDNFPGFREHLGSMYENEKVLASHFADLDQIRLTCDSMGAKLLVVLWPLMQDPAGSGFCMDPVKKHLDEKGIPMMDLSGSFTGIAPGELIVNVNDAHPNEKAHELASKAILPALRKLLSGS